MARFDTSLFSNMWKPITANVPWPFTTGEETKTFFLDLPLPLSVTQKEVPLPNTPTFGSSTAAIYGDSMCLRTCVYPPSANTQRSGTSPVAVCVRSSCWGEPTLGQCLCLYHFPVPETDGRRLLQRKCEPKQSQTRRLKASLTKHHAENLTTKHRFTWSLSFSEVLLRQYYKKFN